MKKTLVGLSLLVSLFSATAANADWRGEPRHEGRYGQGRGWYGQGRGWYGQGRGWYGHRGPRMVPGWAPQRVEQVWEPGRCWARRWGPPVCVEGHYRTVVVGGSWY